MKFKFIILSIILFFTSNLIAENLNISNIEIKNNSKNIIIEFNSFLNFQNYTLVDGKLISPFYESKGTKYYFFSILNKAIKDEIIKSIKENKKQFNCSATKITYKINKFNILTNPKKILAFVSVIFNDNIEVQCNILNGKYGLWISWPSIKENNKWKKIFEIKDNDLKKEIEDNIINLYKKRTTNNVKSKQQ